MSNNWPHQDFASMVAFYGNVGERQTRLVLPYPMRLAWDTTKTVRSISCHEKVHDSMERVLTGIFKLYDKDLKAVQKARMDLFGGCLNVRKIRGGNSWSIHSWGCAIDLDPDHNRMAMHRDQASIPEKVIDIFANEGWTSLGRSRNYDFMHFQATTM